MERIEFWRCCSAARPIFECKSYDILSAYGVRIVVFRRVVKCHELEQLMDRLDRFDKLLYGTPTLFDMRDTEFSRAKAGCIETLARRLSELPHFQGTTGVFVVSTKLGFGLLRMLQQLVEARQAFPVGHLHVTYSVPEALSLIRNSKPARARAAAGQLLKWQGARGVSGLSA